MEWKSSVGPRQVNKSVCDFSFSESLCLYTVHWWIGSWGLFRSCHVFLRSLWSNAVVRLAALSPASQLKKHYSKTTVKRWDHCSVIGLRKHKMRLPLPQRRSLDELLICVLNLPGRWRFLALTHYSRTPLPEPSPPLRDLFPNRITIPQVLKPLRSNQQLFL